MKEEKKFQSFIYIIYSKFLGLLFLISSTIVLGLTIRIIRLLTPLEAMAKDKHLFFSILFFPGLAVLLTNIYPKFKFSEFKKKHIKLLISIVLAVIVSFVMGYLSGIS